ncbi:MAG: RT0821/Lpp0805 family surface protein [Pseudomonadota bacterium]
MFKHCISFCRRRLIPPIILALLPMVAFNNPALAGPPPWAPAHGRHPQKVKPYYHYDRRHRPRNHGHHNLLPWLGGAVAVGYLAGNRCNREALGSVLGGVVGGIAGSHIGRGDGRTAATIAGALLGVLAGKSIGRSMDQVDRYCTGQTLEYAQDRQSIQWQNPDNRSNYSVTPINTYQSRDGRYCREYVTQAAIGNRQQQVYGTACRQPDGSWQIVD